MTQRNIVKLLAAFGLIAMPTAIQAVKKPAAKTLPKPRSTKPDPVAALVNGIFDNSVTSDNNLYSACANSNFKRLAYALSANPFIHKDKGEFETAEEYSSRLERVSTSLNGDRTIIVCQSLLKNSDTPFTYDADNEVFSGSFDKNLRVDLDYKDTGSYIGKTRMGVSFRIKRSVEIDYKSDFAFPDRKELSCGSVSYGSINYKLSVPRAEAPTVKQSALLVIMGNLVNPYYDQEDSNPTPSLDSPYDEYTRTMSVKIRPSRMVVVMPGGKKLLDCML